MAPLRCAVKADRLPRRGYLTEPGHPYNRVMETLVRRTIGVLLSNHAGVALDSLARRWLDHHRLEGDTVHLVHRFRRYLRAARDDLSQWPTMILDWPMEFPMDAKYNANQITSRSQSNGVVYRFSEDNIHVNGLVSL